jgi:hypothetical protein
MTRRRRRDRVVVARRRPDVVLRRAQPPRRARTLDQGGSHEPHSLAIALAARLLRGRREAFDEGVQPLADRMKNDGHSSPRAALLGTRTRSGTRAHIESPDDGIVASFGDHSSSTHRRLRDETSKLPNPNSHLP